MRSIAKILRDLDNTTEEDGGFTLIELAIVIAVIAILIAVALPTFLGVQSKAHKSAAEQNLTNALTSAKSYFGSNGSSYTGVAAAMSGLEPSLQFSTGTTTGSTISVLEGQNGQSVAMATSALNGKCIYTVDIASGSSSLISSTGSFKTPGTYWAESAQQTGSGANKCAATTASTLTWQNSPSGLK